MEPVEPTESDLNLIHIGLSLCFKAALSDDAILALRDVDMTSATCSDVTRSFSN